MGDFTPTSCNQPTWVDQELYPLINLPGLDSNHPTWGGWLSQFHRRRLGRCLPCSWSRGLCGWGPPMSGDDDDDDNDNDDLDDDDDDDATSPEE